ncbi:carboxypeptidase N subunit 2-like isoform X1 [Acropora millepora]|uniref:carboxypeptidase N subunit 2-like isoform X1 n=1 Tax=Acropora millepora TaxID=45264 RepID=UPI001CF2CBBF|nr:carboxypeptidase N subunit 2-like isoform X1 [Acropora millepora]
MKRFWLFAVAILSMCNLLNCDVCKSLCYCSAHKVDCEGKGINSSLLLNISFPTNTTRLNLSSNAITQLPENVFSGLTNLQWLNLNKNGITQLPENVFSGLNNLKEL